jgi:hypothetical protein
VTAGSPGAAFMTRNTAATNRSSFAQTGRRSWNRAAG